MSTSCAKHKNVCTVQERVIHTCKVVARVVAKLQSCKVCKVVAKLLRESHKCVCCRNKLFIRAKLLQSCKFCKAVAQSCCTTSCANHKNVYAVETSYSYVQSCCASCCKVAKFAKLLRESHKCVCCRNKLFIRAKLLQSCKFCKAVAQSCCATSCANHKNVYAVETSYSYVQSCCASCCKVAKLQSLQSCCKVVARIT